MNKSASESNINQSGERSPDSRNVRNKRKREENEVTLANFDDFREEMRDMINTLIAQNSAANITPTLTSIQEASRSIAASIQFLTKQNEDFRKDIIRLENQCKEDKKQIILLEDKIEELQRGQRKTTIEIKNVPKKSNENKEDLMEMVCKLAENVGCDLNTSNINDIYRVKAKNQEATNSTIIVETNSTMMKTEILTKCKHFNIKQKAKLTAKHLGHRTAEDTPIFVSEHLTPRAARLFFLARDLAKSKGYKFCWSAYGKIYVRKSENTPIINIKYESQVQQLISLQD
ncbi:hypothetical protein NE865_11641 [Phthorimaea operculella]|nr:hypothetical protein NE865_11641 [Phthorimaea operculella]